MTLSMTGYGRGVKTTADYSITIDVKSVNHRYLDINFRIPKNYAYLEDKLRRDLSQFVSRGKIDVSVNIESFINNRTQIKLNHSVITAYLTSAAELKGIYAIPGELDLPTIVRLPEVFELTPVEEDQETVSQIASEALAEAMAILLAMRRREGQKLVEDFMQRINILSNLRHQITELAPSVVELYRERLTKRIQDLTGGIEVDPNRVAMEVAIFAERSDINEELVRIASHLQQFTHALNLDEPIGRKLDFLIQELNREINTIGSKANDLQISQIVIEFKAELEKLREQVQNIE
ncbi:MAG TPA: YicC family protein [Bacillota bacterium]|nr:YicC family protein [Bacillota bacterium]HPT88161.1 YicC family protein [Bacillota bacterium]